MNELITLTHVVVLLALVAMLVVEVRKAIEVDARNARAQARGEAVALLAASEAATQEQYADNLRVLYALARDMGGSGYLDQYNTTMVDWVAYSEQEPNEFLLEQLVAAVRRAHEVFDTPPKPTTWRINRNTLQAVSEVFVGTNDGCTYLVIRDELVLSVIYEDDGIFLCVAEPHFVWMAVQYAEEGHIERVE